MLALAAALAACSAPDPGSITFVERPRVDPGSAGGTDAGPGSSSGAPATDGGSSGPPADPVFGTSTFALVAPPINANQQGGTNHNGNVEGKDCVTSGCHAAVGGAGPTWAFAGTVYADQNGSATVPNVEVRVTDPSGTEYGRAYTDANGNFWFPKPAGDIPANSRVGVRDATKQQKMSGTVSGTGSSSCNQASCHQTMRIYLN